jgi:hypothetical protein
MFRLVNSSKCLEHQAATARAVQLGHHQGVASPTGGQLQPQTGSVAAGALEPVIDVDAIITDTNRAALWFSCVSHQQFIHRPAMT